MKIAPNISRRCGLLFGLPAFFLSAPVFQAAPPNPIITLYETGNGMIELPNGAVIPQTGALASDPGPGGLSSTLTFILHPAEGFFTVGDVLIMDLNGMLSSVIRFNPGTLNGTVRSQPILFYSADVAGGLPADTGLPGGNYANTITLVQNPFGPTSYTPVAGQPGFEAVSTAPIEFQFAVPEPSTYALLGAGAAFFFGAARLRRREN